MERCPYCGAGNISVGPYLDDIVFRGVEVHIEGEALYCDNPDCPEPIRFSPDQLKAWDEALLAAANS